MGKLQEIALYYRPSGPNPLLEGNVAEGENPPAKNEACLNDAQVRLLKSVLIRMGIRIKNIRPEQAKETVGFLAGMAGYPPLGEREMPDVQETKATPQIPPQISQDILVLHHMTDSRIDSLLLNLRKSGVPPIPLKAIVTPENAGWTFVHLYEELKKEHQSLTH